MKIPFIPKKIFPELLASDIVGVQPMSAPTGFKFAMRAVFKDKKCMICGDPCHDVVCDDCEELSTIYPDLKQQIDIYKKLERL